MLILWTLAQIAGGLGIFLLAISMLTQGLQMASGNALKTMLGRWTRTSVHGIGLGVIATACLQSSSATTAMVIGLVNASIMQLQQAIWVIFGANIGTTMTSWLVSFTGLDFNIKAAALPLIGFGMMLKTFSPAMRAQAIGTALAGFGLFFFGVDILKGAFAGFEAGGDIGPIEATTILGLFYLVGAGCIASILTQSSSAAIALTLTSVAGGMLDVTGGAAMIIGASLGTTSTAIFAVLGASSNAKRTAAAHVIFNVVTAMVGLMVLPLMLMAIGWFAAGPVMTLAIFHTVYKVTGVLVMTPFVPSMTRFLQRHFSSVEEDEARPHYLDKTTLALPTMAVNALIRELRRFQVVSSRMILSGHDIKKHQAAMYALSDEILQFAGQVPQTPMDEDTVRTFQAALRVNRYLRDVSSYAGHAREVQVLSARLRLPEEVQTHVNIYIRYCEGLLTRIIEGQKLPKNAMTFQRKDYRALKDKILEAAARNKTALGDISDLLDHLSRVSRLMEQAIKAERYLSVLERRNELQPAAA